MGEIDGRGALLGTISAKFFGEARSLDD